MCTSVCDFDSKAFGRFKFKESLFPHAYMQILWWHSDFVAHSFRALLNQCKQSHCANLHNIYAYTECRLHQTVKITDRKRKKWFSLQIKQESFLEDINKLLNADEVPNLYPLDEKQEICEKMRQLDMWVTIATMFYLCFYGSYNLPGSTSCYSYPKLFKEKILETKVSEITLATNFAFCISEIP